MRQLRLLECYASGGKESAKVEIGSQKNLDSVAAAAKLGDSSVRDGYNAVQLSQHEIFVGDRSCTVISLSSSLAFLISMVRAKWMKPVS